jgi:hypothetical protein
MKGLVGSGGSVALEQKQAKKGFFLEKKSQKFFYYLGGDERVSSRE